MSILNPRDDAPFLTPEIAARAAYGRAGKIIRPATGTVMRAGRPPEGEESKEQVSIRLDRDVLAYFREQGAGWQTRVNATLRKAAGLPV